MAVTDVLEIRLLPPLAIGRFGSSPEPMDNYDVELPTTPAGYRRLVPAATLTVDRVTGEIAGSSVPTSVRFRDSSERIRPVAPFLEVWARFTVDGPLEPLTIDHLSELGLSAADVRWQVRAGNVKAARRTGQSADRVTANTPPFTDHAVHFLDGTGGNIKTGRAIRFGDVQYIKPTSANPEIRLRFTPPHGRVFGPVAGDPNLADDAYDGTSGGWDEHNDNSADGKPPITVPQEIYARIQDGGPTDGQSLGYLDDSCDALVDVSLTIGTRTLRSFARVSAGPPDFAPDSFHVRSLADDLEQAVFGPVVTDPVSADEIRDIFRRALETMRLINTDFWNVSYGSPYAAPQAAWAHAVARHEQVLTALTGLDAAPGTPERGAAVSALKFARSILRESTQVGDRTAAGRRLMPPFMRGSDGGNLALTRRQLSKIDVAIRQFDVTVPVTTPEEAMIQLISDLSFGAGSHLTITLPGGGTLNTLFADPPSLLAYLKANQAHGSLAGPSAGRPLIVPGDPDNSAFLALISRPTHPMNSIFASYTQGSKSGIDIVRDWIASLS